jgi:hypothetical protein
VHSLDESWGSYPPFDVSSGDELRAGTPEHFRIVGIDSTDAGKTKFGLVALVLPKDEDAKYAASP